MVTMPAHHGALGLLATAAVLAPSVPGQAGESRGVLAGAATTMLVDGGNGANPDAETLVHANGFSLAAPLTFQATPASFGAPSLAKIFALHGNPPGIDVDAFSTGRDDVLVDNDGVLAVPPASWSVWSFSLRVGAVGQPGSRIAQEAASGSVGAALFTYVLPGSALPAEFVDRTERSHSRRELGLGGGSGTEVDGLDFPLILGRDQQLAPGGLGTAIEPGFAPLIGSPEAIYFSVTSASRNNVPAAWWTTLGGQTTLPSGASILCTRRVPFGALLIWTEPRVFLRYDELGLGQNEDVDALAVDTATDRVLYSVEGTLRDQFLFCYFGTDDGAAPPATPVTTPLGTAVSTKVGKASLDDVDAVCTLDPRIGSIGLPPVGGDDFGSSCGFPRDGLLGTPSINGSAYRRYQGGAIHCDTFLVGWPPLGGAGPGFAAAFLTTGNALDPILIGGLHLRNPGNPIPGDPQTESFVVPPAVSLSNLDVTCRWFAIDAGTGELAEAWPSRIFL